MITPKLKQLAVIRYTEKLNDIIVEPMPKELNQCLYNVKGMHCGACEVLIEKKLVEEFNVKTADASLNTNKVKITFLGEKPDLDRLNASLKDLGYKFSENTKQPQGLGETSKHLFQFAVALAVVLSGFFALKAFGLADLSSKVILNSNSSFLAFFLFGLVAGVSTCAALVGGLLISLTQKWQNKAKPFVQFNVGRLVSYAFFGGILGVIGGVFQFSLTFSSIIAIVVAVVMLVLGLQMLGLTIPVNFALPKAIGHTAAGDTFQTKYGPPAVGALTFFLPCGFTLIAQGLALASGRFITGALMMLSFALGTLPTLALISFSSVKFGGNNKFSFVFTRVSGVLVVLFALFTINAQLGVLGTVNFSDVRQKLIAIGTGEFIQSTAAELPVMVEGKQILNMTATAGGYSPDYLTVKAGVPVKWQITNSGANGCTSSIVSKGLIAGAVNLKPGVNTVEFTAPSPGLYKFSCWMGMFTGTIQAI